MQRPANGSRLSGDDHKQTGKGVSIMTQYNVQSGPLKITIIAETAYDAALEAVRWWGRRTSGKAASHRRALEEILAVRERGQRTREERFPTFNLLAEAEGEVPENAWDRLVDLAIANNN
jgi:hypothetical protein